MNIYVESNFVLELAFEQEQAGSCQGILSHCDRGESSLVIPAFAVAEPFQAFAARSKTRKRAAEDIGTQLAELARNASRTQEVETVQGITRLLVRSLEQERMGLRSAMESVLARAEIIPLDLEVIRQAYDLEQGSGVPLTDAMILASVLRHLDEAPRAQSIFLNRNRKDFNDPDVLSLLEGSDCKVLWDFDDGLGYLRSVVGAN
jgi:predicted nucleic acid-binding protein